MSNNKKQELKQKICKLVRKRPDYAEVLERAIEIENNPSSEFVDKYGWEWDTVRAHPGTLTKLTAEGILNVGYKSRRYKHYKLADKEVVKEALKTCAVRNVDNEN